MYDPRAPDTLTKTQEWFASIITLPLIHLQDTQTHDREGRLIEDEAVEYLLPGPTLPAHRRIAIYNQQYWWRIVGLLQENFPLVVRFLGYKSFNEELAIPYFEEHPPSHWSLYLLGDQFPRWIETHSERKDIVASAYLDWIFQKLPQAENTPSLYPDYSPEEKLLLKPSVELFHSLYPLPEFRQKALQEEPGHPLTPLPVTEENFYVIYRESGNNLLWQKIEEPEYTMLSLFKTPCSIETLCGELQHHPALFEKASLHLQEWFQKWTHLQWLTLA